MFNFVAKLGQGAYGTVQLVERKGRKYALKVLDQEVIEKRDKLDAVLREKEILEEFLDCPQVIDVEATMFDDQNLYFVTEYCEHGTLESLMKQFPEVPVEFSRYVLWELV